MEATQPMSCLICLEADEAGSMISLELAAIGNYAARTFWLCRRCATRIATALAAEVDEAPGGKIDGGTVNRVLDQVANRPPGHRPGARLRTAPGPQEKSTPPLDRSEPENAPVSAEPGEDSKPEPGLQSETSGSTVSDK